ncbi:TetR family transcriptional regulator [Mycobacterium interjectum]|nr:TetR family transcriptional regulator [Mycobacterium interjectum]
MSLFEKKGYEETTVAEIAAAAGVSTKTFFNYFASKDEVLFPHLSRRIDAAVALIERRAPDDRMADVLVAAMQQMLADALTEEVDGGLAAVRLPMIVSVPAVQAATLHRYFLAETQLARALHRAYSDALDPAAPRGHRLGHGGGDRRRARLPARRRHRRAATRRSRIRHRYRDQRRA